MSETTESDGAVSNRLLALLPENEYARLLPKLEQVDLTFGKNIYDRGEPIRFVYFPTSGLISLLAYVEDRVPLEVGLIGSEGMAGLPVFLGVETSLHRAVVQGAGSALSMRAADFLDECRSGGALPMILQRFTHSLLAQVSQSAACNRFHALEARLARWLLMTSDRVRKPEFRITQEFLSNMLGVRREAVSKSATVFQQQQLIRYSRGHISIINRAELEKKACPCYGLIKDEETNFPVAATRVNR